MALKLLSGKASGRLHIWGLQDEVRTSESYMLNERVYLGENIYVYVLYLIKIWGLCLHCSLWSGNAWTEKTNWKQNEKDEFSVNNVSRLPRNCPLRGNVDLTLGNMIPHWLKPNEHELTCQNTHTHTHKIKNLRIRVRNQHQFLLNFDIDKKCVHSYFCVIRKKK